MFSEAASVIVPRTVPSWAAAMPVPVSVAPAPWVRVSVTTTLRPSAPVRVSVVPDTEAETPVWAENRLTWAATSEAVSEAPSARLSVPA